MKLRLPQGTNRTGQAGRSVAITKKLRNGEEKVLKEEHVPSVIGEVTDLPATAGLSMGLTIPGPKGSYMSARIDAWAALPCGSSDGEMRAAYKRAADLIADQLEENSGVVTSFFDDVYKDLISYT